MELTFIELTAFLGTPQAEGLETKEDVLTAAKEWKAALMAEDEPAEFNVLEHIERLKKERAMWYAKKSSHDPKIYTKALSRVNAEIKKYEESSIS